MQGVLPQVGWCGVIDKKTEVPMGSRGTEIDDQATADNTPEDVAGLYSWANLQGAKYRDYSASRREYRAQVRYRAAKALLDKELEAQENAEPEANGERLEAARSAEAAAQAAMLALREEREIAEAHESARQQAQLYEESERRRRVLAGPQPHLAPGDAGVKAQAGDSSRGAAETLAYRLAGETAGLGVHGAGESRRAESSRDATGDDVELIRPAWFDLPTVRSRMPGSSPVAMADRTETMAAERSSGEPQLTTGDTLVDSRQRVASRWFALKGLFEHAGPELRAVQPIRAGEARAPLLAVFSLAGGVGKTSLVATLGQALSSLGEKVLLADTTTHGLFPFYFGLRELEPGAVRAVPPRAEGREAISLALYDTAVERQDERLQESLLEEMLRDSDGCQRLLLDLSPGSGWLMRRMAGLHLTVLVPVAPDMNSVITLQAMERMFRGITDSEGQPLLPYYVLNQFDASLPLHLDIREVFRRQLGDRLLGITVRRSPAVSEALAEGMTVVDYAPGASVAQDYLDLALWLRSISPAAAEGIRSVRGSKR